MPGFTWFDVFQDMRIGRIDLLPVSKRHDYEMLLRSFIAGIHRCIVLASADRPGTLSTRSIPFISLQNVL